MLIPSQLSSRIGPCNIITNMPSGNSHRLYVRARHTSFERGKRRSNPNISHLELEGVQTKKDAAFYLGKKVAYIYRAHKEVRGTKLRVIWGSIRRCHGKHTVLALTAIMLLISPYRKQWSGPSSFQTQLTSKIARRISTGDAVSKLDMILSGLRLGPSKGM